MKIKIIEKDNEFDFEEELEKFSNRHNVKDIKFAVTPDIHGGAFSSYSAGEVYYAMVIYED